VAAASAAGCIDDVTSFRTKVPYENTGARVERLLVLLEASATGDWYGGVQAGLTEGLSRCKVRPTILSSEPLELDPMARALETAKSVQANAVMAIVGQGARASYNDYTAERWLGFELWIVDLPSSKVVWLANAAVKMTGQGMSGRGAGVTFATSIVARLQSDGVLSGCPPQDTRPAPRADEARSVGGTRGTTGTADMASVWGTGQRVARTCEVHTTCEVREACRVPETRKGSQISIPHEEWSTQGMGTRETRKRCRRSSI
jgi:hypothetical protein